MSQATFDDGDQIAIIGMSGRFPGARNIDEFWQNLRDGVESVTNLSNEELLASGVDPALLDNPNYVKAAVMLDDIETFDAAFFSFSPREVEIMDPQHRFFLECAWEALENAGYDSERYDGWIGVYGGVSNSSYFLYNLASHPGLIERRGPLQVGLGNDKDYLTTRVSYKLNLNGPSVTVQTACSTSLVAIHLACQSLLAGECVMALAGAASIGVPHRQGYFFQEGALASPDGHCRSFDAKAQGAIKGTGVGIVVLKLLENALKDGDHIHAVIKGSAVNNDGSMKIGFTAPSIERQAQVIAEALAEADVEAETVTYIEAHGSATPLGDPIEITALTQAFRESTDAKGFCAIGSVKTNIGHPDVAAGVIGLIKTVLALKNRMIPPSLHFEHANPNIDFANSPFYVNTKLVPWETGETPRRAGVSSFGIGGTNAHVILEEAPIVAHAEKSKPWQLVLLSAQTSSALEAMTNHLVEHLRQSPQQNLADIAYTYQVGRRAFRHRRMLVCHDPQDALQALEERDTRRVLTHILRTSDAPITFMFPGLGDHYVSMAQELYVVEEVFRQHVDDCCEKLKPLLDHDLRDVIYPPKSPEDKISHGQVDLRAMLKGDMKSPNAALNQTSLSHAALFVIEYALAQLWMAWGIHPQAMIGYSLGEYVAACLAGVFSLEDALVLVAKRAQMIQELPESAMLAISLAAEEVQPYLSQGVTIAAINGPSLCIVSGSIEDVTQLEHRLAMSDVVHRRVQTSHALHSNLMEPMVDSLVALLETIELSPPQIPYLSNVTGTWMTAEDATDPHYWAMHLCRTIRFADGLDVLLHEPDRVLLEVGPGQSLCSLVMQSLDSHSQNVIVLPSLRSAYDQRSDRAFLLSTLGKLWLMGIPVDWLGFYGAEQRKRVPLPTYPFDRQRYWIEAREQAYGESRVGLSDILETSVVDLDASFSLHPRPNVLNAYVAPRSEIERSLVSIWQELLGIEHVGIHDDFFELGGTSLASVQLVTRLRQVFQVPVPLDYPFKTPLLEDLGIVIEEMFLNRQRDDLKKVAELEAIPRHEGQSQAPLSFAQQHMWNFERLNPGSSVYNIPFGDFVLKGALDRVALEQSLNEIVRRHEILRTTFAEIEGRTAQIIAPMLTVSLPVLNLQEFPEDEREEEARRLALAALLQPFDLTRGPLLRCSLLKMSENEHVLLLNAHHIICDGWSRGVFFQELTALYPAFADGKSSSLPTLPIQYADFAFWQNQWLQGHVLQTHMDYWRQQLKDAPTVLELPTDHARSEVRSYRSKRQSLMVPKPLVDKLRALSRQEDVTLFMVLLAVFNLLLYRYTRQEDILVGTPISNRNRAEIEKSIGCFVNTLVIRTDLSGHPNFRELLRRMHKVVLEAYAHQVLPFEKLVAELHLLLDSKHTPLIQAMLIMHNVPLPDLELENVGMDSLNVVNEVALYDLTMVVLDLDVNAGLSIFLRYKSDLFEDATIIKMLRHWLSLLENVVTDPDQLITDFPLELPAHHSHI